MHIVCVHRGMVPERVGGTYSYIYELYRRLAARGHEVRVIASTRQECAGPPVDLDGIRVHRYSFRRATPLLSTLQHLANTRREFARIAERRPVDILSVHESQLGYALARSRLGSSICQVPTFHAPVFLEFRLDTAWRVRHETSPAKRLSLRASAPLLERAQRALERGVLEAAQGIVVLSRYTAGHIEREFPSVDRAAVEVIPGGVDTGRFRPAGDRAAVRASLGVDPSTLEILTVRNLAPRMGLENLIEAMVPITQAAAARGLAVTLSLCGDGPLRSTLETLVVRLGLAASVRLLGRVTDDELVRRYQAADLFVLPTVALEGFGISTVEALSTNLPVVGTPAGATPEILGAIDARLLTADTTSAAIARSVIEWLDWRREDAGTSRYRDEVMAKYDWPRIVDRVEAYYAERADRFRSRPRGD